MYFYENDYNTHTHTHTHTRTQMYIAFIIYN